VECAREDERERAVKYRALVRNVQMYTYKTFFGLKSKSTRYSRGNRTKCFLVPGLAAWFRLTFTVVDSSDVNNRGVYGRFGAERETKRARVNK